MTAFEYLSVLLSIILGLAITQVLQGYRSLLLARTSVRIYWPTVIWSVLILLFACQAWWASFGLEDYADWRFDTFLVIVVQMALVYMGAAVVLPDVPDGVAIDLEAHYEAQRRPFFACLLLVVGVSLLKDLMLQGTLPGAANLVFHAFLALMAVLGLILKRRLPQLMLALAVAAAFIAYVGLLFARL